MVSIDVGPENDPASRVWLETADSAIPRYKVREISGCEGRGMFHSENHYRRKLP